MNILTLEELALILNADAKKVMTCLDKGIPHLKIGALYRFLKEEAVAWYEEHMPSQERLEEEFVDGKGRKLDQYIQLAALVDLLRVSERTLYRQLEKGMPSAKIGIKRFYHPDDVIDYFRVKASTDNLTPMPVETPAKKENETSDIPTIVVDGSFNPQQNTGCAGVVLSHNGKTEGFSFLMKKHCYTNVQSEDFAVLQALKIAEERGFEKVRIGTDQQPFIYAVQIGSIKKYGNRLGSAEVIAELKQLLKTLSGKVEFFYANLPEYRRFYKNSHSLSRRYRDSHVKSMNLKKTLPSPRILNNPKKVIPEVVQTAKLPLFQAAYDMNLDIEFKQINVDETIFQVTVNGKKKTSRFKNNKAVKAALHLAHGYIANRKGNMKVRIGRIPTFADEMNTLFDPNKKNTTKTMLKLFDAMETKTSFHMVDDYTGYTEKFKTLLEA